MQKTIYEPANDNTREDHWGSLFLASPPLFSFRTWRSSLLKANNMSPSLKAQRQIDDLVERNAELWQKLEVAEEMLLEKDHLILALKKKLHQSGIRIVNI